MAKVKRNAQDKRFVKLIGDAFTEVMVPALDGMEERLKSELASKKDLSNLENRLRKDLATKDQFYDAIVGLDSIDEKLDKIAKRQDYQEEEILNLKNNFALA